MLKIKLSRTGKKNQPHYRIVVSERRSKATGKVVDSIGHYHPLEEKNKLTIDKSSYQDWLKKGAQPTNTVRNLVEKK